MSAVGGVGTNCEWAYPQARNGSATRKPASGPAAPMSTSAFLVGMRSRTRMTAPSVPNPSSGSGMKYGRLALTPWRRART